MPGEEDGALTVPAATAAAEDAALLAGTAAGDRTAFERFVARHEAAVLRYVRGLVDDADRAEDVLQERFIAAWRGAAGFRGGAAARGWLLSIARHAAQRHRRRRAGEPATHLPLEELARQAGFSQPAAPDLARAFEARELVERGFRALSPEEREVLILRELEGFSGEETAALLGLSLAAMKSRLHRARLRFLGVLRGEIDAHA